jgi:FixJ family two-component response regulator
VSKTSLISVVDDDTPFLDSMRRLVKALGYSVVTFRSGAEFLVSPSLTKTDCLVADVHMPAMTGVELYRHLIGAGRRIPTILITAYPDDRVEQRVSSEGVACYLRKPLEEAILVDCLRRALAMR